jgi:DNA-binding transcriptional LysR family regulator
MNAKLLRRTPKGVELTAVGKGLLLQVRRLRLTLDDILRQVSDLSEGLAGELRVGTGPDFSVHLVPTACAELLRDAPGVTLKMTVGTADVMLPALTRGELDLVVTASSSSGYGNLVQQPLLEEEYVVYCSINHRLAGKGRVTLADLSGEKWALAVTGGSLQQLDLHRILEAAGLPAPKIAVESNSIPFRLHLLPSTDLLAFLPKRAFHENMARAKLTELRVRGLSYSRTVAVCHRKDAYLSPAVTRFIGILKAVAQRSAAEADRH